VVFVGRAARMPGQLRAVRCRGGFGWRDRPVIGWRGVFDRGRGIAAGCVHRGSPQSKIEIPEKLCESTGLAVRW